VVLLAVAFLFRQHVFSRQSGQAERRSPRRAECFQDRTKRFGFQAQNVQPKTRLTLLNVIMLGCGQIISWIGMKVCPYVMGCYVAGIRIVFSSHPKKPCKTKYAIRLVGILPLA